MARTTSHEFHTEVGDGVMEDSCDRLVAMLESQRTSERRRSLKRLENHAMLPCLESALRNPATSDNAKRLICEILYRMRWPDAVPALLGQLHSSSQEVRAVAADALGNIGDVRAGPALLQLLEDENQPTMVRDNAAFSVGLVGYRPGASVLARYLHDPAETVRYCAAKALGWLGDPSTLPALEAALRLENAERVRRAIEEAIRNITSEN